LALSRKDLLARFRDAAWGSESELATLASSAEDLTAADVVAMLDILSQRGATADMALHRQRLRGFAVIAGRVADRKLFLPYVRAMQNGDPAVRSVLVDLLPGVNDPAQHGQLCAALRSPDGDVRRTVALALRRVAGRTAFEMLSEMVRERAFVGRSEAMDVLSHTAGHHAVPAYESVLGAGSTNERVEAIAHLVEPACVSKALPRVLKALESALDDPVDSVACAAVEAYASHATEDDYLEATTDRLELVSPKTAGAIVQGLRHFSSPRVVELLRQALRRGPNAVRLGALEALEGIALPEALDPLVEALGHRQVAVRTRAGEILVRMGKSGRVDLARTVVWLLRSKDLNVRRMAIEVAQSVKDQAGSLWPKLVDFLYDEDWWIRERVIDALIEMAGQQLVPHFVRHLEDEDVVRRYYAVEILGRLGSQEALGAMLRVANNDSDWLIRESAIQAIAAFRDERAIPAVVNIMMQEPDLRLVCIEALETMGVKSAASHVALLLTTQGMEVDERMAVLRCLRSLDDPTQLGVVRRHTKDPDPEIRKMVRDLLWRWEGQSEGTTSVPSASVLDRLLGMVADREGDDLILIPGRRPAMKRIGRIMPVVENVFSADQVLGFLRPVLSSAQVEELEGHRDVDLSYEIPDKNLRFRVNVFHQYGGLSAVFRIIRDRLLDLEQLGLPAVVRDLANLKNGLVLVGGPTGSGKSTTLAALIDNINATSGRHIITLEDPIEVAHGRKQSLINQRELGTHTNDLSQALRATLRQDPDVILVGEMRDAETISFGITAAETGHLVFGTIHTVTAATTVDRLINACPAEEQEHVRAMLAGSLRAVVCQYLHKRRDQPGRCLSVEVMLNNEAVANLIRSGKSHQISSTIATSRNMGMQLMDVELMRLMQAGQISAEDAFMRAANKKDFEAFLTPGASLGPGAGA
jgi:twitching motility protein PilT